MMEFVFCVSNFVTRMGRRVVVFDNPRWQSRRVARSRQDELPPLLRERCSKPRTAHFNLYSCGNTQQVAKLLPARLEQSASFSFLAAHRP